MWKKIVLGGGAGAPRCGLAKGERAEIRGGGGGGDGLVEQVVRVYRHFVLSRLVHPQHVDGGVLSRRDRRPLAHFHQRRTRSLVLSRLPYLAVVACFFRPPAANSAPLPTHAHNAAPLAAAVAPARQTFPDGFCVCFCFAFGTAINENPRTKPIGGLHVGRVHHASVHRPGGTDPLRRVRRAHSLVRRSVRLLV